MLGDADANDNYNAVHSQVCFILFSVADGFVQDVDEFFDFNFNFLTIENHFMYEIAFSLLSVTVVN